MIDFAGHMGYTHAVDKTLFYKGWQDSIPALSLG
jgi:hypothetical protein